MPSNESLVRQREIRVRPVVRYIITDFVADGKMGGATAYGTFENPTDANMLGKALADADKDAEFFPCKRHVASECEDDNMPKSGGSRLGYNTATHGLLGVRIPENGESETD